MGAAILGTLHTEIFAGSVNVNGSSIETGIGNGGGNDTKQEDIAASAKLCQEKMDAAREAISEGKLGSAGSLLAQARGLAVNESLVKALGDVYVKFNDAGQAIVDQTDKKYAAGDYADALKEYAKISSWLGSLPAGASAKSKLDEAEKNPTVRAVLHEAKAAALYEVAVTPLRQYAETRPTSLPTSQPAGAASGDSPAPDASAVTRMPVAKQAKLVKDLQSLVKLYGDCPTGQKASALLQQLQGNPELMRAVAQFEQSDIVRKKFDKAQMYHNAKLYVQASKQYEEIYTNYPDSPYADKARQQKAAVDAILSVTPH